MSMHHLHLIFFHLTTFHAIESQELSGSFTSVNTEGSKRIWDKEMFVEVLVLRCDVYLDPFQDHYIRKKFRRCFIFFNLSFVFFPFDCILPVLHSLFLKRKIFFFLSVFFKSEKEFSHMAPIKSSLHMEICSSFSCGYSHLLLNCTTLFWCEAWRGLCDLPIDQFVVFPNNSSSKWNIFHWR